MVDVLDMLGSLDTLSHGHAGFCDAIHIWVNCAGVVRAYCLCWRGPV